MQAVLAQTGHVEHKRTLEFLEALRVDATEIGVTLAFVKRSCEVILPVGTILDFVHLLSCNHGKGSCRGWCLQPPLAFQ